MPMSKHFKKYVDQTQQMEGDDESTVLKETLIDCLHLAHKLGIDIHDRLEDAKEVFIEEQELDQDDCQ